MEINERTGSGHLLHPYIIQWFRENHVQLITTRSRTTKLGDYRSPVRGKPARITVNPELNDFEFVVTLVHEMAHHEVWKDSQQLLLKRHRKIRPHGITWKNHYSRLMQPLLVPAIFPHDMLEILKQYFQNPKASSKTEAGLVKILKKYDPPDGFDFLEALPYDAEFMVSGGRTFRKKEKLRKRYRCINLQNKKIYLFNPLVRVTRM
jgi:hypothetical protein